MQKPLSPVSDTAKSTDVQPEDFRPPDVTSLASLTDGRDLGDYRSYYDFAAWAQIVAELLYLVSILVVALGSLAAVGMSIVLGASHQVMPELLGTMPNNAALLLWATVGLSGVCGGATSSLKWHYHSVAKRRWHRDRIIWRLVVPLLSGVLAVFTGLMITSGLIPFFSNTALDNPAIGAGFGFFVGLFSDNLLASLQRLAYRVFGTVNRRGHEEPAEDTSARDGSGRVGH